ncbi:metalloprotease, partial [Coemansia furcata]
MLVKAGNASKDDHVSLGEAIDNFKVADWETGFESKLAANSLLPYKEYTGLIEKSGNDKRQYRLVRLPNNLVALCIQDTDAKEAAASLSVNIGSNANPAKFQGLAHFLEHMLFLVTAFTSDPAHPYSGFNVGNTETLKGTAEELGLDLREELIKFYQNYYSADIMRLAVVGNHSLDTLTEWVTSKFSDIKSKGDTKPMFDIHPIGEAQLGKLIHYQTVQDSYELTLQFSLPELKSTYGENPFAYISALLNHKESGSIYSVLRKNGWATSINAGIDGMSNDGFSTYDINVIATPEGLESYEAIVNIIFAYINMLVESGPQEWYYQELSLVSKAEFDFKDKEAAENCVLEGESNLVYVTQCINQFIRQYRLKLQEMTVKEFESSVQSLISIKQEKPKSIDDDFFNMWSPINSDRYNFGKLDDDIEHLRQLSKDDLLAFWDKYVNEDTAQRYTRLDLQMWSAKIWLPTVKEFEVYPSTVLALYGTLRSGGHTAL